MTQLVTAVVISDGACVSTGFLLSEQWVMTVAHGLKSIDPKSEAEHSQGIANLRIHLPEADLRGDPTAERVVFHPEYAGHHHEPSKGGMSMDVALIKLAEPLPKQACKPGILAADYQQPADSELTVMGVRPGSPSTIDSFTKFRLGTTRQGRSHEYALQGVNTPGHSGGPLIRKDGVVVGMLFEVDVKRDYSYAIAMPPLLEWLNQHIPNDIRVENKGLRDQVAERCTLMIGQILETKHQDQDVHAPLLKSVWAAKLGTLQRIDAYAYLVQFSEALEDYSAHWARLQLPESMVVEAIRQLKEILNLVLRIAVREDAVISRAQDNGQVVLQTASIGCAGVALALSSNGLGDIRNRVRNIVLVGAEQAGGYRKSAEEAARRENFADWRVRGMTDFGLATSGIGLEVTRKRLYEELWALFDLGELGTRFASEISPDDKRQLMGELGYWADRGCETVVIDRGNGDSALATVAQELGIRRLLIDLGDDTVLFFGVAEKIHSAVRACLTQISRLNQ